MFRSFRQRFQQDSSTGYGSGPAGERAQMVDRQLRSRGVRCEKVLGTMGRIERERFLPPGQALYAYRDQALPLAHGQTVSQPYMVAVMTEALRIESDHRVLEIGTGSGYQTAVLAELAREVHSVERIPELSEGAGEVLADLGLDNISLHVGDGTLGLPEAAPFQRILVTAGAPAMPELLQTQLDPDGGRLVVPVGDRRVQDLIAVTRNGGRFETESILACRFVPLVGEEGWGESE